MKCYRDPCVVKQLQEGINLMAKGTESPKYLNQLITVCNEILLFGQHGVLQSPGYPERTLENRFCKWRIQTTRGNRIRLIFHFFRITESNTRFTSFCRNNYLEVNFPFNFKFPGIVC